MIGGFYAKAKQRVLNKIGRRTSKYGGMLRSMRDMKLTVM